MNYLLDTHTILWYFEDSSELPPKIVEIIDNPDISIYVSSVSLWEIAIKMNLNKLDCSMTLDELIKIVESHDFNIIQIENEYLKKLSELPFIHKDPFDRMIISTAISEDLTIITVDDNIQKYNVSWIW